MHVFIRVKLNVLPTTEAVGIQVFNVPWQARLKRMCMKIKSHYVGLHRWSSTSSIWRVAICIQKFFDGFLFQFFGDS